MKKTLFLLSFLLAFSLSYSQFLSGTTAQIKDSIKVNSIWYKKLPSIVTTLQEMQKASPIIGNTVQWIDSLQGGQFTVYSKAGFTVDSALIFPHQDTNYVWVRNRNITRDIQLEWFKRPGESDFYKALLRLSAFATANDGTVVNLHTRTYPIDTMKTGTPVFAIDIIQRDSVVIDSTGTLNDTVIVQVVDTVIHVTSQYVSNNITNIIWLDPQNLHIKGNGAVFSVKGNFERKWTHSTRAGNVHFSAYNTVCPFEIAWGKNVTIENLTVNGNDDQMTESGNVNEGDDYGIVFRGTDGITVKDVTLHHLATDGLYIEGSGGGADGPNGGKHYHASRNATIDHVTSLFCGRQGVTIGGLNTAYFKNCVFSNTGDTTGMGAYKGHAPGKGLDIEPVYEYAHANLIRTDRMTSNILFENCRFEDNNGGSIAMSHPFTTKGITFKHCVLDNSKFNHFYFVINNVNDVTFDGCDINTGTGGFYLTRDNGSNQKMTLKNNFITSGSGVFLTGSAAQFGVTVDNNTIRGKHDTAYKGYFPYFSSFGNYTHNTIIIDSALYLGANQRRLGFYSYANIIDGNTYLSEMDTTGNRKYNITYNFNQTITNEIYNPKQAVRPIGADTMHFENNAKFTFGEVNLGTQQKVYTGNGSSLHIYYRSTLPTTGQFNVGDIIVMTNPVSVGYDHYRCVVSGDAALGTVVFSPVGAINLTGATVYHNAHIVSGSDDYIGRYIDSGGVSKFSHALLPPGGVYFTKVVNDTGIVAFKSPLAFNNTGEVIIKGTIYMRGKGNTNFTVSAFTVGNHTFSNPTINFNGDTSLLSTKARWLKDANNDVYLAFFDTASILPHQTDVHLESITLEGSTQSYLDHAVASWTPMLLKSLSGYTATSMTNTSGGDYNLLINKPTNFTTLSVSTTSATLSNLTTDRTVVLINASGTSTITLPAAASNTGKTVTIKTISTNGVIILGGFSNDPATISAASYGALTYYSTGTTWYVTSKL